MLDENMLRMQQEAVERVRQMQERARRYVESEPPKPSAPVPAERSAGGGNPSKSGSLLSGLGLGGFGEDKDQLFLLMIAVLLVKNEAPIELILALLYIAM